MKKNTTNILTILLSYVQCSVIISIMLKDNDDNVWLVDPKDSLYDWIKKLSGLLRFLEVLFIIDEIIANESLDKKRQSLLELVISGRHRDH